MSVSHSYDTHTNRKESERKRKKTSYGTHQKTRERKNTSCHRGKCPNLLKVTKVTNVVVRGGQICKVALTSAKVTCHAHVTATLRNGVEEWCIISNMFDVSLYNLPNENGHFWAVWDIFHCDIGPEKERKSIVFYYFPLLNTPVIKIKIEFLKWTNKRKKIYILTDKSTTAGLDNIGCSFISNTWCSLSNTLSRFKDGAQYIPCATTIQIGDEKISQISSF